MKKGDRVVIRDGSWTQSVMDGRLVRESLNYGPAQGRHYAVVETGCRFPLDSRWAPQPEAYRNNTVIQDVENGKVVFIHDRFLRPATHIIVIDGKTIEVSDESFKALKQSLGA